MKVVITYGTFDLLLQDHVNIPITQIKSDLKA